MFTVQLPLYRIEMSSDSARVVDDLIRDFPRLQCNAILRGKGTKMVWRRRSLQKIKLQPFKPLKVFVIDSKDGSQNLRYQGRVNRRKVPRFQVVNPVD
jgi:hypothetical protein